jgi:hypothetical protein
VNRRGLGPKPWKEGDHGAMSHVVENIPKFYKYTEDSMTLKWLSTSAEIENNRHWAGLDGFAPVPWIRHIHPAPHKQKSRRSGVKKVKVRIIWN